MEYRCRRGHLHGSKFYRDECNDNRGIDDDGPVAIPTYPVPFDLTPDIAPSTDAGPEFSGFDGGADYGSGGAGGGGDIPSE